jgi:hypothetical protein
MKVAAPPPRRNARISEDLGFAHLRVDSPYSQRENQGMKIAKTAAELTELANAALREQPGCGTVIVPRLSALPNVREGRNWEIPNVVLGDCLISDVDRAVITVHHRLGRQFRLLVED